jgi:hypothetical protein
MTYALSRTSMALDQGTLQALKELTSRWGVSKAEVMRRAVKKAKEESDREAAMPSPLSALHWLQSGGGLTMEESAVLREDVREERQAKHYWWES